MALDGIYLYSLVKDLKKSIINSKIDKINQPEKDEIILTLRKDRQNIRLLISSSPKYPRIHITEESKPNPLQAPMFTMVLRKYLIGGKILGIEQIDCDRLIKICIESSDELGFNSIYYLIVEIMGRHSNISLVRERDNKIMECIKHVGSDVNSFRTLYPGVTYNYPPVSPKLNPFKFQLKDFTEFISNNNLELNNLIFNKIFTGVSNTLSKNLYKDLISTYSEDEITTTILYNYFVKFIHQLNSNLQYNIYTKNGDFVEFYCMKLNSFAECVTLNFPNPNVLLDKFYKEKDKQERLKNRSINLQRLLHTNIDRCLKKVEKLDAMLAKCKTKEDYKIKGDLLTSFIYSINPNDSEITLHNFYSEDYEDITINLDPNKSPAENVQSYYKKYNKLKKSEEAAKEQLEKNSEELLYLNSVLINIQNADNYEEIEDIKNELITTEYIRKRKQNKNSKKSKTSKPLHFISSDGIDIYVGKNNIQNDYLSLKLASKNHLWLHTKNIPGSHVIICATDIPDSTLEEAASLAAYYSKAQNSTKVPVDYTLVKNLKKPSGAKPGMVIYHTNYTLYTDPKNYTDLNIRKE